MNINFCLVITTHNQVKVVNSDMDGELGLFTPVLISHPKFTEGLLLTEK